MAPERERLTRRAPDGKVYFRVAKRQKTTDETWRTAGVSLYHWCASESPEVLTPDTPLHVCDIWGVADDQAAAAEPETAAAIAPAELTTAALIQRVLYTEEQLSTEPVPLLVRAAVLALLQQAKAMEQIIVLLDDWRRSQQTPAPTSQSLENPLHDVSQRNPQRDP